MERMAPVDGNTVMQGQAKNTIGGTLTSATPSRAAIRGNTSVAPPSACVANRPSAMAFSVMTPHNKGGHHDYDEMEA